jgi:uncharacterized protein involved in exopolysaccharide biosynthesis
MPTDTHGRPATNARRRLPRSPVTGRVAPSTAVVARPMLVLLPVLVFLVPGLFLSLTREPVYTAQARLLVGGFNAESRAVPGFVEASKTLAETYARLVSTPAIQDPTSKALQLAPSEVDLSATAVPESSIIAVEATSTSQATAVRVADAGAKALVEYTQQSGGKPSELLKDYVSARQALAQAQAERDQLAASGSTSSERARAEAELNAAQARSDAAAQRYENAIDAGSSGLLQIVAPAGISQDDRRQNIQLTIAATVGLGLIIGIALATLMVNREAASQPMPQPVERFAERSADRSA